MDSTHANKILSGQKVMMRANEDGSSTEIPSNLRNLALINLQRTIDTRDRVRELLEKLEGPFPVEESREESVRAPSLQEILRMQETTILETYEICGRLNRVVG